MSNKKKISTKKCKQKKEGYTRRSFLAGVAAVFAGTLFPFGKFARSMPGDYSPIEPGAYSSTEDYDVVIIGSGAAGMVAALTAAKRGLRPVVIEKAPTFGGSTARSGGGIWIRNNEVILDAGVPDTPEKAATYLAQVVGNDVSHERQAAYLENGPEMISFVLENTPLRFRWMEGYPDYYPELPGAMENGASIEPDVFDGNILGEELANLNPAYIPTPPGIVPFGGDYKWLTLVAVNKRGLATALQSVRRYLGAISRGEKPLTMGQALAAGLRAGLLDAGVPVWLNSPLIDINFDSSGRADGVLVMRNGTQTLVRAGMGVVIASGGFEHNLNMRTTYQRLPIGTEWTVGAKENTGDGILAGERAGAALSLMDDAWWGPTVPLVPGEPYFCLSERSLPGSLMVNDDGVRFVNESGPYHDVVNTMYDQNSSTQEIPVWMITDQKWRNRYLFKSLPPLLPIPREWYRSGAVTKAWTIKGLARKIGISPGNLRDTVKRFNRFAENGDDQDFGRGDSQYDRYYADPRVEPNPSLGRVAKPPFYAFKIVPGDLGTKGGLVTDEMARVVRPDGSVIPGLYAAGNTSSAVMGRSYAGAGSTLGPAMTFGYIAANSIAEG